MAALLCSGTLTGLEPPVRGPGVQEGRATRRGWVRSHRVYNVRLRSDPIGRRQEWKRQADVTFATREPSGAEVRLGPEEGHHGAAGPTWALRGREPGPERQRGNKETGLGEEEGMVGTKG